MKTALLTGLVCLVISGGLSAFAVMREGDRLVQDQGTRLAATARVMAHRLDAGLTAWRRDVALLARFSAFKQQPPDPVAARALLQDLKSRAPEFSWIGFTGMTGVVIAATGGMLEGHDVSARPWFAGAQAGVYLGDVHPAVLLARLLPASEGGENAYFVDAAAPVTDSDGRIIGVVAGHMNWLWAESVRQDMLRQSTDRPLPELLVLGREGRLLLGPEATLGQSVAGPAARQVLSGVQNGWLEEPDGHIAGFARTIGSEDHGGLGWSVLARRDAGTVLQPIWPLALWLGLGSLGVALVGGLLAGAVVARFGHALRALNDSPGRRGLAEELARMASTLSQLRNSAHRDPLTGLLNRAGFAEWRRVNPSAEGDCALLALDLDGFKPINDRLGHAAGDAVLAAIGQWFLVNLRGADCAVRLGGDEFLLCLRGPPGTASTAATEVIERFQATLHQGLQTQMGPMALGCSIGIALVPQDAETIDAGMLRADADLYAVKRRRSRADFAVVGGRG